MHVNSTLLQKSQNGRLQAIDFYINLWQQKTDEPTLLFKLTLALANQCACLFHASIIDVLAVLMEL